MPLDVIRMKHVLRQTRRQQSLWQRWNQRTQASQPQMQRVPLKMRTQSLQMRKKRPTSGRALTAVKHPRSRNV